MRADELLACRSRPQRNSADESLLGPCWEKSRRWPSSPGRTRHLTLYLRSCQLRGLVPGATERRPVRSSDAKSGASFEQMTIEGSVLLRESPRHRARLDHAGDRQHRPMGAQGVAGRPSPSFTRRHRRHHHRHGPRHHGRLDTPRHPHGRPLDYPADSEFAARTSLRTSLALARVSACFASDAHW